MLARTVPEEFGAARHNSTSVAVSRRARAGSIYADVQLPWIEPEASRNLISAKTNCSIALLRPQKAATCFN